jgi:hypothetical protein
MVRRVVPSTKFRPDSDDLFPLRETQESLFVDRVPKDWDEDGVAKKFRTDSENVLMMKTSLGEFTGRCLILTDEFIDMSADGLLTRSMDHYDTRLFVEHCENFFNFSNDLRRLCADKDSLTRIVTLTGVPKSYSRRDVASMITKATDERVQVDDLQNIVFRYKMNGSPSDTVFVLLKTESESVAVIEAIQEYAVPKRRVYGAQFGCSFVFADRSSLFLSDPELDYALDGSKYWVTSFGWNEELDEVQMKSVLEKLKIFPNKIVKVTGTGGFLLRFDRMKETKLVFSRLHKLKRRWRIPKYSPFYAYPVRADIHYKGDEIHDDQREDCDSDLDEPVEY